MNCKVVFYLVVFTGVNYSFSQETLSVQVDKYKQEFEGAGTSIGLYIGHHFSQSEENQDLAIRLINEDLNMTYLQDYQKFYPEERPDYYDLRANYILAAKQYRPEGKVSFVFNNYPARLRLDSAENAPIDVEREGIYDSIAVWYFKALEAYKLRGVDTDIINLFNEPDFNKKERYGFGDPKKGTAEILKNSVPVFKSMIEDPDINTLGVKMPLIMVPSTLSTGACLNYINYYRDNYPEAWELVDVVATHQYGGGISISNFQKIEALLDGRGFIQSEQHAGHSDNLNLKDKLEKPHWTCLDLAALFATALNNGVSSWFYFENNYPQEYHAGGLIRVPWGGGPTPYKQYYAFKQLTSSQPVDSHVLTYEYSGDNPRETVSFRKIDEDTLYVNISNFDEFSRSVSIDFQAEAAQMGVKSYTLWTTDETSDAEMIKEVVFTQSHDRIVVSMEPYSVNTLKVVIDENGFEYSVQEQTLTFESIEDQEIGAQVVLNASLSSELVPSYELISGDATLEGNTLTINDDGVIKVRSFHPGNDSYLPSNTITHEFCGLPAVPTITESGNELMSSAETSNLWFKDGTAIEGASGSGQIYEVTEDGSYQVRVGNNGCYSFSEAVEIVILHNPKELQIDLRVWYKAGYLNIHKPIDENGLITIYQLDGSKILETSYSSKLSFSAQNGIFLLVYENEDGQVEKRKFYKYD